LFADPLSVSSRVLAAVVYYLAGLVCFVWVLNRTLNYFLDSRHKRIIMLTWWLSFTLLPGLLGCWRGLTPFVLVPGLVLAAGLGAEWRLFFFRKRHRLAFAAVRPVFAAGTPATYDLRLCRVKLSLPGPAGWRLRAAHLSDLHLNSVFPREY
jgi:hypothetical protein